MKSDKCGPPTPSLSEALCDLCSLWVIIIRWYLLCWSLSSTPIPHWHIPWLFPKISGCSVASKGALPAPRSLDDGSSALFVPTHFPMGGSTCFRSWSATLPLPSVNLPSLTHLTKEWLFLQSIWIISQSLHLFFFPGGNANRGKARRSSCETFPLFTACYTTHSSHSRKPAVLMC